VSHHGVIPAGMTAKEGKRELSRPLPYGPYYVPRELWIESADEEEFLVWDWESGVRRREVATDRVLDEFLRLAGAPSDLILEFARRYGPLFLGDGGLPKPSAGVRKAYGLLTGSPVSTLDFSPQQEQAILWNSLTGAKSPSNPVRRESRGREPVARWRELATYVNGLLRVAMRLNGPGTPRPGTRQDWALVGAQGRWEERLVEAGLVEARGTSVDSDRQLLARRVETLLYATGVTVRFSWPGQDERPSITLDGKGSLAGVALQLAFCIGRHNGFRWCKYCGDPFFPPHGNRVQCNACKEQGAATKAAKKRHSDKARRQNELWIAGNEELLTAMAKEHSSLDGS
jgi:hypothetical protein